MNSTQWIPTQRVSSVLERRRRRAVDPEQLMQAGRIVEDVRSRGEVALREWSEKFGDLTPAERWVIGRDELQAAVGELSDDVRGVLERTSERVRRFASQQLGDSSDMEVELTGGRAGHRMLPVAAAGCYAPGGRFPLPSSVIMTAVTARVAGVERVIVASPKPTTVTKAAAAMAGADMLLAVGGAQAIGALTFGVGDVAPVDVVVGPGNSWVTAAKKWVVGDVGIDMLAGPSELLVVADDSVSPELVAGDLIAQAEHDPEAVPVLVAFAESFAEAVREALSEQLATLPTAEIASQSLQSGFTLIAEDRAQASSICDIVAPEHLQVLLRDSRGFAQGLRSYGGLFIGAASAEVLGDYGAGPNHVLPTGATARFSAGLSVQHFLRQATWLELEAGADRQLVDDAVQLARLEGLEGHARAAERRLVEK